MFTGLVESLGRIVDITISGGTAKIAITPEKNFVDLKYGESIAVNGACLTLEKGWTNEKLSFHALEESLNKTNLKDLKVNDIVNLERALALGDRLGGHLVQGHIDTVSTIRDIRKTETDFIVEINMQSEIRKFMIKKGSIAIDGISLTLVEVNDEYFSVHIIPTTLEDTSLKNKKANDLVNLETDLIGKYVFNQVAEVANSESNVTMESLFNAGF